MVEVVGVVRVALAGDGGGCRVGGGVDVMRGGRDDDGVDGVEEVDDEVVAAMMLLCGGCRRSLAGIWPEKGGGAEKY
ncbi:hypothetical protein Tco_1176977 [Tanacetum coccineum]